MLYVPVALMYEVPVAPFVLINPSKVILTVLGLVELQTTSGLLRYVNIVPFALNAKHCPAVNSAKDNVATVQATSATCVVLTNWSAKVSSSVTPVKSKDCVQPPINITPITSNNFRITCSS